MSIGIAPILIILLLSVGVGVAMVVVVAVSRRRQPQVYPRCGSCGYNLTGAPSNRCPECGELFIEAGVITRPPTQSVSRRTLWFAVVAVLLGLAVVGALGSLMMTVRARAAKAQAIAARQAAVQAQMQARAAALQAAATMPATEGRPTAQPSEAP